MREYPRVDLRIDPDHIQTFPLQLTAVKMHLIFHPQKDQARTGNTDRQPKNIQEAVRAVTP